MKTENMLRKGNKLLLIAFVTLSISTFYCCSMEEDISPELYEYTSEQKQEIQALAEKYGIHIQFNNKVSDGQLLSMQEIEKKFQDLAKLSSTTYPLTLVKEGEVSTFPELTPYSRAMSGAEEGSWNGKEYSGYYYCNVTIRWRIYTHSDPGMIDGDCYVGGHQFTHYTPQIQSFGWASGNTISFSFKGDLVEGIWKAQVEVSGHVNILSGIGTCYIGF